MRCIEETLWNMHGAHFSCSLDMQHEILAGFMGYELLHPSIDVRIHDGLNVADVGTGTG